MSLDYVKIYERVSHFLTSRDGFNMYKDFNAFVAELTGIICEIAFKNDCDTNCAIGFIDSLEIHELKEIPIDGKLRHFDSLVHEHVSGHVLYKPFSERVMKWIPGNVQAGKGEALFCIFDDRSIFGTDPNAGFDIVVDLKTHEFKSLHNNFSKPETFDNYTSDNITIVKGMMFASTRKDDWRKMVKFTQTERQIKINEFSMKPLT